MNILLVGEEAAGARAVRRIAASGHRLVGVLTGGGSGARQSGAVESAARELGVPVSEGALVRDAGFPDLVRSLGTDVLINVHSLFLIPGEALGAPTVGAFNLHPGPLPEYAGLDTVSWALWEGAEEYGVTLHWMEPRVDAGALAYQRRFPVPPEASALTLMNRCVQEGMEALADLLRQLEADPAGVPRLSQDLERRRYYGRGRQGDTQIDWSLPAGRVVGRVRACDYGPFHSPWGRATAKLGPLDVVVRRVRATDQRCDAPPGSLGGACGDGVLVASADRWVCVETVEHDGWSGPASELPLTPGAG